MVNEHPRAGMLADLSPASFAIVMATGIVGLAAAQQGFPMMAIGMVVINGIAWPVLVVLTLTRALLHRREVAADLRSHQRAPGFFTMVAGTGVLAAQLIAVQFDGVINVALAWLAPILWLVLTYGILTTLTIQQDKPALADGISGAWLLAVVSTQSIAMLTALIASHATQPTRLALNFGALALWLVGGMLYVWIISLIFYRYAFLRFTPEDFTPTYWINMGAVAISTVTGALLVLNAAPEAPFLLRLLPVLMGGTVLFWAVATWWIPILVALSIWRYVLKRQPLRYEPSFWAAVFPLGMYSAATHQMSLALDLPFLSPVALGFFYIAAGAWLLTASGLVHMLVDPIERTK